MAFTFRDLLRRRQPDNLGDQELVGLLEPGVVFDGRMNISSGMVRLNTHLKGEIRSEGVLVLAELCEVEGEIHSRLVSVAGKVKGAIHAAEKIEIKAHGVVLGDIYTAALIVEPGGYFDGQCHMPAPEPANQVAEPAEKK
ncbi:MAG: polymer-forming cytoskeletal protein [Acidobacteria bacterium]|nr:polymer-forming cytoskeletal protein [Acidobacteriota bacterium]